MPKQDIPHINRAGHIFVQLINTMDHDNGCHFCPSSVQMVKATRAIGLMLVAGAQFTPEEIVLLAAGEESEREDRFSRVAGFDLLHEMLNEIFNGPVLPPSGMPDDFFERP